ncbi:MAG: D-2-hydroxyacid dehydrogenase [Candidatus Caldarchaeum sp.]|nr:D-2-hydroxyacid dehydrogenase [Candidatus Caldarchaeum sp.]MDW7978256.1 D-2-hydroxyacid dehydrogenase [Candidatus Caldarchaeum sp.]MDW8359531.1 D-2-hydroxyacid dehydrogenase [Candidatus Caldarchaeum sp.]
MGLRVLVADPIDQASVKMLKEAGFEVEYRPDISAAELEKTVKGCSVLVVRGRTKVTAKVIESGLPSLKVVGRAGVGLDNVDVEAAARHGVKVLNTPEAPTNSVAELVIGLMLAVSRKIAWCDRVMRAGKWPKHEAMGVELAGKTLGVIGYGRIGRAVAKIAHAMGMRILAYDVIQIPAELLEEADAKLTSLEEVLKNSDVITLHVPLTPETRHFINSEKLALLKPSAILVNASRGEVVDEEALYKALSTGRLAGAGLDVFEREPPTGSKLLELDNVVATPHIGAQTYEAQEAAGRMLAAKIIEAIKP